MNLIVERKKSQTWKKSVRKISNKQRKNLQNGLFHSLEALRNYSLSTVFEQSARLHAARMNVTGKFKIQGASSNAA
jgi:hypothetical protein